MKIQFRQVYLSRANKARLNRINAIIENYQMQGYRLTLRQLYYQLVIELIIPNEKSEYAKLSTLLKEGRMGGIVDWNAIEDRLRQPYSPASFDDPKQIIDAAIQQYALPRQNGQEIYIEVWVEKDALSGVLRRVTAPYHIPIMVNRGYSSVSAMFDSYQRFKEAYNNGQNIKIFYLGDYDPSGIDMIRDIHDRIVEFCEGDAGMAPLAFSIEPIALTRQQIDDYNPPPNPVKRATAAKKGDPRAEEFVAKHGTSCWEVDALKPEVLHDLVEGAIRSEIDLELYEAILKKEKRDKTKLRSLQQYL
jgi:hypothetical protein